MVSLHDALEYHDRGFSIVPCNHRTKAPRCDWKRFQTERPTESQLHKWFGADNQMALAVVAGKVSDGLVVRDFDVLPSYERWATAHPDLATTLPTVATARGRHVYIRADLDGIRHLGDGELRGAGVTLLPPSRHPSGSTYKWLIPLRDRLPLIDLAQSGLTQCNTEYTENTDYSENTGLLRRTKAVKSGVEQKLDLSPDEDAIQLAIVEAIPIGPGHRTRRLFDLARALKAIPALADASYGQLKPYIRQWHKASLERIETKPFEDSWETFVTAWSKVRFPKGQGHIDMIFQDTAVADLPLAAQEYEGPDVQKLVCFCRELQRASGDKPFYLSCRTAGKLFGVDHVTASRWLHLLCIDEILKLVAAGELTKRQAATYRYIEPL